MIYVVTDKSTGAEVYRYQSEMSIEWNGMEFSTHTHTEFAEPAVIPEPVMSNPWRIHVGAFFDRFGTEKLAILSSADLVVQAVIKDASVRKYIALTERRDELAGAIALLNSKGFSLDEVAILDLEPTADEVWNG